MGSACSLRSVVGRLPSTPRLPLPESGMCEQAFMQPQQAQQARQAHLHLLGQRRGVNCKVVVLRRNLDAACRVRRCCKLVSRARGTRRDRHMTAQGAVHQPIVLCVLQDPPHPMPMTQRAPVGVCRSGWLPPWCPNLSLKVLPPSAWPITYSQDRQQPSDRLAAGAGGWRAVPCKMCPAGQQRVHPRPSQQRHGSTGAPAHPAHPPGGPCRCQRRASCPGSSWRCQPRRAQRSGRPAGPEQDGAQREGRVRVWNGRGG